MAGCLIVQCAAKGHRNTQVITNRYSSKVNCARWVRWLVPKVSLCPAAAAFAAHDVTSRLHH